MVQGLYLVFGGTFHKLEIWQRQTQTQTNSKQQTMAQTNLAPARQRPRGNSKAFALPSSSSSSSSAASPTAPPAAPATSHLPPDLSDSDDSSDDAPLPFPAALPRSDFLAPEFDAAAYLSSLPHRHQTLEDLRSDLRERGSAISAELLELVNANYTSFLSLGSGLRGGEERVEDVRVALLGFRRTVEEVRARVADRRAEVAALNRDRAGVAAEIEVGRKMLELDERVEALEDRLAVGSAGAKKKGDGEEEEEESENEDEEDDEEDEVAGVGSSAAKLAQLARDYVVVEELADAVGRDAPFVRKMEERMVRCRNTILLDLSTALKEAKKAGAAGQAKLLKLLGIYALMDAQADAVKVLKGK